MKSKKSRFQFPNSEVFNGLVQTSACAALTDRVHPLVLIDAIRNGRVSSDGVNKALGVRCIWILALLNASVFLAVTITPVRMTASYRTGFAAAGESIPAPAAEFTIIVAAALLGCAFVMLVAVERQKHGRQEL